MNIYHIFIRYLYNKNITFVSSARTQNQTRFGFRFVLLVDRRFVYGVAKHLHSCALSMTMYFAALYRWIHQDRLN